MHTSIFIALSSGPKRHLQLCFSSSQRRVNRPTVFLREHLGSASLRETFPESTTGYVPTSNLLCSHSSNHYGALKMRNSDLVHYCIERKCMMINLFSFNQLHRLVFAFNTIMRKRTWPNEERLRVVSSQGAQIIGIFRRPAAVISRRGGLKREDGR